MMFKVLFTLILSMFAYGECEKENIIYQHPLIVAELGGSVNIPCFYSFSDLIHIVSWYKQPVGKKPLLIAYLEYRSRDLTYRNGFDKVNRYFIRIGTGSLNLSIINLEEYDLTTYYCAVGFMNIIQFGDGTVLVHDADSASSTTVHKKPVLDVKVYPGDSVSLQCSVTVITEICAGEYSVYWFRHGWGYFHPRIIYTHRNMSDHCMRRSENGSLNRNCVYSLPKRELKASDDGIYYCAVDACGKLHYGNGTKLTIKASPALSFWNPIVLTLLTICIISMIVIIFLVRLIQYNHKKAKGTKKQPSQQRNQTDDTDALNYAALSIPKRPTISKSPPVKSSQEETIYSQMTSSDNY
ncbi:novel immune-type receptor 3a [Myxocyprinus asiaticus]|uniref:novel immune-type receptor 3a n=1 Tax=Myxocyprinus asiaticus TaxID=70543 RepID=UPI002221EA2A|nr:novel immune-type receptor 3a [Myxocyprinus asiaticus]XP_051579889.1 novel immune-type receptor 3a [Myxocyprinus asiaticus]